ncbi:MAG: hypothetical protein R2739_06950 [Chitinophagales bacterium]|nr:hypothetical protein [Bacteroidota bacterium]
MNKIVAVITLLIMMGQTFAENNWKLEKNENGIKIWNRKKENSALKEFKAIMILNTTPENLINFFKNTTLYDKWMYKVDDGSVKVIKRINSDDYYTYMTISAPLIKTRETITHMVFHSKDDEGNTTITLDGAPTLLPKNNNYVRINDTKGYFKIIPIGNGKVELVHQAWASPGGSIPDFLANISSVDCPYYMFTKIKSLL